MITKIFEKKERINGERAFAAMIVTRTYDGQRKINCDLRQRVMRNKQ